MIAKLRSRWKKIRKPLGIIGIIAACIGVAVLVFVVIRLYGTGFEKKNLWDWLGLLATLAIPVVVGFGAAWFTAQQGKVSDRENKDNQREVALQAYIDKLSELLLKGQLGEPNCKSNPEYEQAHNIARVRTITILFQLDARRMSYVFAFLREAKLMSVVGLDGADFSTVNWSQANLSGANLSRANLSGADLSGADLYEANLSGANLSGADLRKASLRDADLRKADLRADLDQAKLCEIIRGGPTQGTKHTEGRLKPDRFTRQAKLRGAILSFNLEEARRKGIIVSPAQMKKAKTPRSLGD